METKNDFPYYFDSRVCKSCNGKCCRGVGGYIWVSMEEMNEMARVRNVDVAIFSKQYIRQVQGRFSLQERVVNGEHFCCFFDQIELRCTMYKNRPKQCRTFPFWDQFKKNPKQLLRECPGVSLKISWQDSRVPCRVNGVKSGK